jgi:small subunit ribosomal protein S8
MIIDPIGDLLTRIRNGQLRRKSKINSPNSRLRIRLLDVLQAEGYIRGYAEVETKGHKELEIELKYHEGQPVIRELKRVSTPGRRVYSSVSELKPHRQGLGVSILSTPQGVMTDTTAREKNVGGRHVTHWQETRCTPQGRYRLGGRPDRQGQGSEGRAQRQAGSASVRLAGR